MNTTSAGQPGSAGKKYRVTRMFDEISPKYDLLNHLLSFNIDKAWRKKLVSRIDTGHHLYILDVATGTADLAVQIVKSRPLAKVVGVDLSIGMLNLGKEKVKKNNLSDRIELLQGDAENINFEDNSFDVVTVAFGVRNYEHLSGGLKEMNRVLKPGGKCLILEFSTPKNTFMARLYRFYFHRILPLLGKIISGSNYAYTYLPQSVESFPNQQAMEVILNDCGFNKVNCFKLTFGVCTLYEGIKD
jgi:demethylmenaquinone methyltransferase/2-methoxy-6-polyprenyl-1,4-benzoquinol methylase